MLKRIIEGNTMFFYEGSEEILSIREEETADGVLLTLKGELRSETSHHLQDELEAFATIGVNAVLDFQQVRFISFAAIYALLNCQHRIDNMSQGSLTLRNIPDEIFRVMDEAHVTEMLQIEE